MKPFTDDDIEALLQDGKTAPPPEDLLSSIKGEIPASFMTTKRATRPVVPWLAAAAVVILSIAGIRWYQDSTPEHAPSPVLGAGPPPPSAVETTAAEPGPTPAQAAAAAKPPVVATTPELPPGEIRVLVVDDSGGALRGARVSASVDRLKERISVITNEKGVARLEGVPVGEVQLRAELPGFVTQQSSALLSSRAGREVDITLQVAPVLETVTVTGEAPRIHVVDSAISSPSAPPSGGEAEWLFEADLYRIPPSTGGTREPNDALYDRTYFQHYGVHPFVDTEDDPLSTFGPDVDTGSYAIARRFIEDGHLPDPDSVRVEEFVNSFDYDDPPPSKGDFSIRVEGAPTPFTGTARTRLLRIGIRARDVDASGRRPAVLTFLVDVSGSMDREDRLELVKKALGLLIGELRPEDRVGLVVFGTTARIVLEPTSDREVLKRGVDGLSPEGSTNLESGLALAYQVARTHAREEALNRIILCSDGVANEGRTGWESLLESVSTAREGIALTAIGFGMGNYNDVLMEQLANHADGNYAYVDDIHEAKRLFVHGLTGLIETVAGDAKVQVRFEPSVVESYRLLGYENRAIADPDFRDDTKDAGEIGVGHRVSALYEIKMAQESSEAGTLGRVQLRYRSVEAQEIREIDEPMMLAQMAPNWEAASPSLRLAAVVAELAEILRGSYWAQEGSLEVALAEARKLLPELSERQEVVELVSLLGKAVELR